MSVQTMDRDEAKQNGTTHDVQMARYTVPYQPVNTSCVATPDLDAEIEALQKRVSELEKQIAAEERQHTS